jgi:hypothetical protein
VALGTVSPGTSQGEPDGSFDGSFDGTWTIDTESGSFEEFMSTFAGYRVEEELGGVGAHTAVERTPGVTGSLAIEGTTIAAVSIEVDMTTLTSDIGRRRRLHAVGRRRAARRGRAVRVLRAAVPR